MVCSITYPWMLCTCGSLCTRGVLLAATFGPGPLGMLVLNVDEVPVVGQFQAMDDGTACSAVCPSFPGAGSNSAWLSCVCAAQGQTDRRRRTV